MLLIMITMNMNDIENISAKSSVYYIQFDENDSYDISKKEDLEPNCLNDIYGSPLKHYWFYEKSYDKSTDNYYVYQCEICKCRKYVRTKNVIKSKKIKKVKIADRYAKDRRETSYKKIVKSYKQLKKLKKYIRKNFNSSSKYLKVLKKYTKKYFKKKTLIFAVDTVDETFCTSDLKMLNKEKNKLIINIDKVNMDKEMVIYYPPMVKYYSSAYFINLSKSDIKKIKKVKIKYNAFYTK